MKKKENKAKEEKVQEYRAKIIAHYLGKSESNDMTRVYMALKKENSEEENET